MQIEKRILTFIPRIPGIEHDLALVLQCVAVAPMQNWIASNYPIPIFNEKKINEKELLHFTLYRTGKLEIAFEIKNEA